MLRLIRKQW